MNKITKLAGLVAAAVGLTFAAAASAQTVPSGAKVVGQTLPAGFPVILDNSLGTPLIGFGGAGYARRTPVVFIHGNGATPFPTGCETAHTNMQAMAQYFADNGYDLDELWGVGWQGNQCDLIDTPANAAGAAHTHAANVPDLVNFVKAVLASTGASRIDVVAHGMGVTLAREAARQTSGKYVRRFVAIDGPNQGTLMCSADPANQWQLGFLGGYGPNSPLCQEIGSPYTTFLQTLNNPPPSIDPKNTLVIRNSDSSYPYMPWTDGLVNGVPAVDVFGNPVDFTNSARIRKAAYDLVLTGQGIYDTTQASAHIGIANSPTTWQNALRFLKR